MDRAIVVALVVALVSGMTIGIQSSLLPWAQRLLGAATTGMLVNVAGGTLSLGILLLLALRGTGAPIAAVREGMPYWGLAGALGVGIMVGLSFALPRAGVAAGLAGGDRRSDAHGGAAGHHRIERQQDSADRRPDHRPLAPHHRRLAAGAKAVTDQPVGPRPRPARGSPAARASAASTSAR